MHLAVYLWLQLQNNKQRPFHLAVNFNALCTHNCRIFICGGVLLAVSLQPVPVIHTFASLSIFQPLY